MKKFKKIMAVLVAAMMIMATMVPAWAATITIYQNNKDGIAGAETYDFYKIFDVTKTNDAKKADVYTAVAPSAAFDPAETYYTKTEYPYVAQSSETLKHFVPGETYYTYNGTSYTAVDTSTEEFHSSVTYYTKKPDEYTKATISSFASGTTYYTKADGSDDNIDTTDDTIGEGVAKGYAYTISTSNDWFNVLGSVDGTTGDWSAAADQVWVTLTKTAGDDTVYNVQLQAGKNSEAEAKKFAAWLKETGIDGAGITPETGYEDITASEGTARKINVDDGYYLITSSLGTRLILATSNIKINTKNQFVTDKKTVGATNYNVGDFVKYQVTVDIPATVDYNEDITIHDTMDNVLGLVTAEQAASGDHGWTAYYDPSDVNDETTGTDFSDAVTAPTIMLSTDSGYTTHNTATGHTIGANQVGFDFVIDISDLAPGANAEPVAHKIIITYYAELKDEALADTDYVNTEFTTYSNYKTEPTTVTFKTYDIDIEKWFVGEEQSNTLNAKFNLYAEDPVTHEKAATALKFSDEGSGRYVKEDAAAIAASATSVAAGGAATTSADITVTQNIITNVRGLSAGTYYLTEIATSDGYKLLEEDIVITIASDGAVTYSFGGVNNSSGSGYAQVTGGTVEFDKNETYYTKETEDTYVEVTPNVTSTNFSSQTLYKYVGGTPAYVVADSYDADEIYYRQILTDTYTKDTTVTSANFSAKTAAGNGLYTKNTIDVKNYTGTILPSTGGMGTTVLYIVGGMLVILAGAYLFFSRKRTA